jgi:hypothetical protein
MIYDTLIDAFPLFPPLPVTLLGTLYHSVRSLGLIIIIVCVLDSVMYTHDNITHIASIFIYHLLSFEIHTLFNTIVVYMENVYFAKTTRKGILKHNMQGQQE